AALLRGLLAAVESDSRWEWMELGCSVAAGRGDEHSDLDLGLAYGTGEPPPMDDVTRALRDLGDVVDLAVQPWEDYHRWWVQYRDGGQIDLLVVPATIRSGRAPRSVVLLDRQNRLQEPFVPSVWRALPGEPRQWLLDGWEALSNVVKYLHRGSLLECIEQLHRARTRVLQLWAVGEGVDYPRFGLASLLDDPQAALPKGIESTYPPAESAAVTAAAEALARLLGEAGHHAETGLDSPLRSFVTGRIRAYVDGVELSTRRG
ncbi:MAG: hypothetical protein JWR83_3232, partial [Aeromicrobium sp.]|nr:hypothetical protein [Aeromicrobium sp.]